MPSSNTPAKKLEAERASSVATADAEASCQDPKSQRPEPRQSVASRSGTAPALAIAEEAEQTSCRETGHVLLDDGEPLFRALSQSAQQLFFVLDADGNLLDASDQTLRFLGCEQEELPQLRITDFLDHHDASRVAKFVKNVRQRGSAAKWYEIVLNTRSHGRRWIETTGVRVQRQGHEAVVLGIARDITQRQKTEQALRETATLYRALFDNSLEMVFVLNPEGQLLQANERALARFGLEPEELPQLQLSDFFHERYLPQVQAALDYVKKRRSQLVRGEAELRTRSGRKVWVEAAGTCIYRDGKPHIVLAIARDVTKNKKTEVALQKSEQRFRSVFDKSLELFFINDINGQFTDANKQTLSLLGYSREEITSMAFTDLLDEQDAARAFENAMQVIERGADTQVHEYRLRAKDGSRIWVEASGVRLARSGQPPVIIGIARNITERKAAEEKLRKTEEQLRMSQKMEAVGRLAGGIAHDFNNLLAVITGNCELILSESGHSSAVCEDVMEIFSATKRASELTRQLLTFSRKDIAKPEILNLNTTVSNMEKMLGRLIGEDIQLVVELDPNLEYVMADRGQMEQVIMNLAINARDAMPKGGTLTIRTANVRLDEGTRSDHIAMEPGPCVALRVTDTGTGIEEGVIAHVFEPFFTTKDVGKGTGLGLSTVYGIVRQAGGDITVQSTSGNGTSFEMLLPRVRDPSQIRISSIPARRVSRGSETILVVEDEAMLRRLICKMLTKRGYRVLEAKDGVAALEMLETEEVAVDLLLTDVVMPTMGGPELARQLTPLRPGMKVLYMSGYPDDDIGRADMAERDICLLEKPFSVQELEATVRQLLDET